MLLVSGINLKSKSYNNKQNLSVKLHSQPMLDTVTFSGALPKELFKEAENLSTIFGVKFEPMKDFPEKFVSIKKFSKEDAKAVIDKVIEGYKLSQSKLLKYKSKADFDLFLSDLYEHYEKYGHDMEVDITHAGKKELRGSNIEISTVAAASGQLEQRLIVKKHNTPLKVFVDYPCEDRFSEAVSKEMREVLGEKCTKIFYSDEKKPHILKIDDRRYSLNVFTRKDEHDGNYPVLLQIERR